MKEGLQSKFHQPVYFTLNNAQISFIKYNEVNLYYTKFKKQNFQVLIRQYNTLKHSDMLTDFNGLVIKPELLIEQIIQNYEQERVFQYVINRSHLPQLVIPKKWSMAFNRLISKIIKSGMYSQSVVQNQQKNQIIEVSNNKSQNHEIKQKNLKMLIYWVDDQPKNNLEIIGKSLNNQKIEVKQLTSTQETMQQIQTQYHLQKNQGRSILIISDMARLQNGKMNYEAGIDLFQYIYYNKKLNVPSIAFVSNKQKTYQKMNKRKLKTDYIKVLNETLQLIAQIQKYLNVPPKK